MQAVFLGGSRRIARLNDGIRSKLDSLIGRGLWFFVGDANGADRALQQHLANRGYQQVVVYAVAGSLRNNVGHWKVHFVDPPRGARGFELYSAKDRQMANDASYGFMLWDGKSRGTFENIHNLLAQRKPVEVHLVPARRFVSLKSKEDLHRLGLSLKIPQPDLSFGGILSAAQQGDAADGCEPSLSGRPRPRNRRSAGTRGRC